MRQARVKVASVHDAAVYHCLSRVVDRRFVLRDTEKEMFRQFLREYEQFCGVHVLTYCLMSNHFHILVEVPKRPDVRPEAAEVLRRLEGLSGAAITAGKARQMLAMFATAQDEAGAREYLEQFYRRMWDVSQFMKLLKQRFTQWYNRRMKRQGTLWEDRFKSLLVEGEGDALMTMAAYIELNPVRAGLVNDPGAYRWSGYGEAVGGRKQAREALRRLYAQGLRSGEVTTTEALRGYRLRLFIQGEAGREGTDTQGNPLRRGMARKEVLEEMLSRGRLGMSEYLQLRVRYFSDGLAVGSRAFVEGVFGKFRDHFGPQRRSGARRMRGLDQELFTARDLKVNVFG